jgi:hypothetical protein
MNCSAWNDIPEDLWWVLYESKDPEIRDWLYEHHLCVMARSGSRVNDCDSIAHPGSFYCERHGEFD